MIVYEFKVQIETEDTLTKKELMSKLYVTNRGDGWYADWEKAKVKVVKITKAKE